MKHENIRIIVDKSSHEAEGFAEWLVKQGFNAYVEPAGRHGNGETIVETTEPLYEEYESDEDFIGSLWAQYCQEG